jgi:hypothetical protein
MGRLATQNQRIFILVFSGARQVKGPLAGSGPRREARKSQADSYVARSTRILPTATSEAGQQRVLNMRDMK